MYANHDILFAINQYSIWGPDTTKVDRQYLRESLSLSGMKKDDGVIRNNNETNRGSPMTKVFNPPSDFYQTDERKYASIEEKNRSTSVAQTTFVPDSNKSEGSREKTIDCGCPHVCTTGALKKKNNFFSCGFRISFLMENYNLKESKACEAASVADDAPCGKECNPETCSEMTEPNINKPIANLSKSEWPDPPFSRYEGVVVVTKVLSPGDLGLLKQMLCTFTAAYNRNHFYDILVFTTFPWTEAEIEGLQRFVSPANLSVLLDSPPLEDQLATMTAEEVDYLEKRCKLKSNKTLTWRHHCDEPKYPKSATVPLGYAWQAEFRAYHLWRHPALSKYKYMIWMDSDSLCTKNWSKDPMKHMVENDLVVMFDNFPRGSTQHIELNEKMMKAYGRAICFVRLNDRGTLYTTPCKTKDEIANIGHIHGFHHITNLNFYRSKMNLNALRILVGNDRFSRFWDDQLAVTLPAAMEAPELAWDYRTNGLDLGIHHNGLLDGKDHNKYHNYKRWFENYSDSWEAGEKMCNGFIVSRG
uniref:Uncharacterized protein n=1 Tax=Corethron hystrix TaxID=216773 RepID=A0A7S1B5K7_9STRA